MSEIGSILRKDVRRVRWTLFVFAVVLVGNVAMYCRPLNLDQEARQQWDILVFVSVLTTWLLQFVLVTQLIHGDAPARVGAQWRSRPFRASHLTMGKIGGVVMCVLTPPWFASQAGRVALGMRPGIGDYEGPLYHFAALSAFGLIAVATTSIARSVLVAIGLLIAFGFSMSIIMSSVGGTLGSWIQPVVPADLAFCLSMICLATVSLLSAYRGADLSWPFVGIGWLLCLLFGTVGGASRFEPNAVYPEANERFHVVVAWQDSSWRNDEPGWYGTLRHTSTDPRRVVVEAPMYFSYSASNEWWLKIIRGDGLIRVDGLGDVDLAHPRHEFESSSSIGPLDPVRFGTRVGPGFGDLEYTVRTYDLLGQLPFDGASTLSKWTWNMRSVRNPHRLEVRILDNGAKLATLDPSTNRLQITSYAGSSSLTMLWPIGAGVQALTMEGTPGANYVLLHETIVGKGVVGYEYLPLETPPNWRAEESTTLDSSPHAKR